MSNQEKIIRNLERNIIGIRYLLEVYKIAYEANSQAVTTNKALAGLLANTYLRSLVLAICAIYSQKKDEDISLEKSLKNTFSITTSKRPDLESRINESITILKKEHLTKIRNKKIAHIDMEEITASLNSSDPKLYEKLTENAEVVITEILEAYNMKPMSTPPKPDTDPALIQLKLIFTA